MEQRPLFILKNGAPTNQSQKELDRALIRKSVPDSGPKKDKIIDPVANKREEAKKLKARENLIVKINSIKTNIEADPDYNIFKYKIIRQENELVEYINKAISIGEAGIDTETSGLDVISDYVVGVCLYVPGELPCYIPIRHIDPRDETMIPDQLSEEFVREELKRLGDVKLFLQNAKFDMLMLKNSLGVTIKPYWDTMIAGILHNENEPHGLKAMYDKYVGGGHSSTYAELFKGIPFQYVPIEHGAYYAAKDPHMTYLLAMKQMELFYQPENTRTKSLLFDIEMPMVEVLAEMKNTGVYIDNEYANKLSIEYNQELSKIEALAQKEVDRYGKQLEALPPEIYAKINDPINLSSPTQLAILIYDVMGLTNSKGKSVRGTGEEIINEFISKYSENKFFPLLLQYRGLKKLLSTYVDAIPKLVNEKSGKLHADFNQLGADTGRTSSSEPNLQNIPAKNKDIRKMFIAKGGYYFIGGDYSQQEPRILTYMSKDPNMYDSYINNLDLYARSGSRVFKVPYDECQEYWPDGTFNPEGKKKRDKIKSVILGTMYGRGDASIAEQLDISIRNARDIRETFMEEHKWVGKWIEEIIQFGRTHGYVETVLGRRRHLPELKLPEYEISCLDGTRLTEGKRLGYISLMRDSSWRHQMTVIKEARNAGIIIKDNTGIIAHAERQAVNSPIQGSASDMVKKAMIMIYRNEHLRKLRYRLQLLVHDEIIGSAPKDHAKEASKIVQDLMLEAATIIAPVPMKVDMWCSDKWYGEEKSL